MMPRTQGAQEAKVILAIDTATPAVTAGIVKLDGIEVLAERVTVCRRGGHTDPQARERAWAATDHNGTQIADGKACVGERGEHVRGELLGVCAGVDGDPLGAHLDAVELHDARGDRRSRGIDGQDHPCLLCSSRARHHCLLHCQTAVRISVSGPRSRRMSR